ncbi:hypothetical protein D9619_009203 [Psilocybe cf. subviscida]|uniref:KOW domain-containing protein n=1 Tax=Psilocybe cf. subviscida TaxID=2480587 RepID=A0A8H5BUQ7_9AGAR|nr:hypothetical protein D9619_009203 [Psilocybe cf. subviscida]
MSASAAPRVKHRQLNPFVDIEATHTDEPSTDDEEEEALDEFIDDTAATAAPAAAYLRENLGLLTSNDEASVHAFLNRARERASQLDRAVNRDDGAYIEHILEAERNSFHAQTWRAYCGSLKVYRGDTGLVVSHGIDQSLMLALLPRLKGNVFTMDGLLLVPLLATAMGVETVPSREELALFSQTTSLAKTTYDFATRLLSRQRVEPGKRVKILFGEFTGLVGRVNHVQDSVVDVWLECQNYLAQIPLGCLRMHFCIGDQVKVVPGVPWNNTVGWVINIRDNTVSVYMQDRHDHVEVISEDLDFYSAPFVRELSSPAGDNTATVEVGDRVQMLSFGLQGMRGKVVTLHEAYASVFSYVHEEVVDVDLKEILVKSKGSRLDLPDRYAQQVGQAVYVVGATDLKRCRGYIRSTLSDGTAWVYLEASQRSVHLKLKDLLPIPHGDVHIEEMLRVPSTAVSSTADGPAPTENITALSTIPAITPAELANPREHLARRPKVAETYPSWLPNVAGWGVMVVQEGDPYAICTVKRVEGDSITILKEDEEMLKTTVVFHYLRDADPIKMVIKTKVARQLIPNQQEELQAEELLNERVPLIKVWNSVEWVLQGTNVLVKIPDTGELHLCHRSLPDPWMEGKMDITPTRQHPRPVEPRTPTTSTNGRRGYHEMSSPETSPTKRSRIAGTSPTKEKFNWPRTVAGMIEFFSCGGAEQPAEGREAQFFMDRYPSIKHSSFYKYFKEYKEAKALKLFDKHSDWAELCKEL